MGAGSSIVSIRSGHVRSGSSAVVADIGLLKQLPDPGPKHGEKWGGTEICNQDVRIVPDSTLNRERGAGLCRLIFTSF